MKQNSKINKKFRLNKKSRINKKPRLIKNNTKKKKIYKLYGNSSTIDEMESLIHYLQTEINTVIDKPRVYIISIGCSPNEEESNYLQIYGQDIVFHESNTIIPKLIVIDRFKSPLIKENTIKYIENVCHLSKDNYRIFDCLLPVNEDEPIYQQLQLFVNQFNNRNPGCVIMRNFIRYKNIDNDLSAESISNIEFRSYLIYKILYTNVFLNQSYTPHKLLLRWFGYTEKHSNAILSGLQQCLFIETNDDSLLLDSGELHQYHIPLERTKLNSNKNCRLDSVIYHFNNESYEILPNLQYLKMVPEILDHWKPISFDKSIENEIIIKYNHLLTILTNFYKTKGKPIPPLFKNITPLELPFLSSINITNQGNISIE